MTRHNKVFYTSAAIDDMEEIFSFISQDNVSAAEKMLERLDSEIGKLRVFPRMGAVLSEEEYTLISKGYRFIVVYPYLVFYRILDNRVIIHRILHGRRDYLRELFMPHENGYE